MTDRAIEEIRSRRRKVIADNYDGSIQKMTESIIARQKEHPKHIVNLHDKRSMKNVA